MPDTNRPDAIIMPTHFGGGGANNFEMLLGVREAARKLLGVDLGAGELAYCGPLPAGQGWLCARDPKLVILLFPTGHPMAGQPRYKWTTRPDGLKVGTLVPDPFEEKTVEHV